MTGTKNVQISEENGIDPPFNNNTSNKNVINDLSNEWKKTVPKKTSTI